VKKLYKKFLIYKAILKGMSPDIISQKFNISRNVIYKIKKEGFLRIKEKEKLVLDYFQKNPFSSVNEISKNLNFSKSFVYRMLRKYNIFNFKQSNKKILKILEFLIRKNDFENLKNFINYYNIDLDSEILNFENVPFEIKYIELSRKLNSGVDISYELENYLNELKEKELNFIYLKALVIKFDVLILKKQYKEIIKIFENLEKIDDMICLSLKAKFYNSYLNALSLEEEFEKGFTILKKIKRIYKKLTKKEKLNIERFISAFYYNYGNYKKAYDFSKNHPLLRILCLYQKGEYLKVINPSYSENEFYFVRLKSDYLNTINNITNNNISSLEKFIYIYSASISILFLGESKKMIETFIKAYDIEKLKFEDIIEFYYVFMTIYYKFIGDDNYIGFFKKLIELIGNRIDKHFYAIVSKDISNLKNSTNRGEF
jgi:transposase